MSDSATQEAGAPAETNTEQTKDSNQNAATKNGGTPDAAKKPKKRLSPVKIAVLMVVLIAAGIGGVVLWQYLSSYVSTDDAEVDAHISAINSRIAGTVAGVYAEDNQVVKAGQTLVDLDPRDYKIALEQAQAQLGAAKAAQSAQSPNVPITQLSQETNVATVNEDIANAQAALSGAKQSYQSALAQLRQAEANYQNAASDEARYAALVKKDEVSQEQYDEKRTAKIAQQAIVEAQRASADAAKDTITQREAALAQARQRETEARQNAPRMVAVQQAQSTSRGADVERAQADVDQALLNLTYCKIASPVTGVVGKRSVEVGQQISPGQQLMAITNLDDLWVTANFKETQLRNVKPGQTARVHVDAIAADFDAFVESLPGASGARYSLLPPENATGNYVKVVQRLPVRIRFKSDQAGLERLRPGMSVEPKIFIR